jgi:hypothetical protein
MILYHHTADEYLKSILMNGLSRGDVPLTQTTGSNAVWLTIDPDPSGHGLTDGRLLSLDERAVMKRNTGQEPRPGAFYPNKRRIRIKTIIPSSDRLLKPWLPWARKRLKPDWLGILTDTGGGKAKAKTWYIYQGVIPPDKFVAVERRDESGTYYAVPGFGLCRD